MFKPYGMIPALPTPMHEGGEINYEGLEELLEFLINNGVHGLLVGGSTGEYSLMSLDERKEVMKFVCDVTNGRVPVMAGTGCHLTKDTIELTQFAAKVGAKSALVINPYYMATSRQGVIDYYKSVAKSSDIGILIYNYPDATGVNLEPELIHELSKIDGVIGIKNTADGQHTSEVIALTKDNSNFIVLTGFEHLILATLAMGGHGAIGVVHNLVPEKIVKLYNFVVKENNIKKATELNKDLLELYSLIEEEVIPGTVKTGLEILGLAGGATRAPLVPTSEQYRAKMKDVLNTLGELNRNK